MHGWCRKGARKVQGRGHAPGASRRVPLSELALPCLAEVVEHGREVLEAKAHAARDGLARVAREEEGVLVGADLCTCT